jgi:hypothetical protein
MTLGSKTSMYYLSIALSELKGLRTASAVRVTCFMTTYLKNSIFPLEQEACKIHTENIHTYVPHIEILAARKGKVLVPAVMYIYLPSIARPGQGEEEHGGFLSQACLCHNESGRLRGLPTHCLIWQSNKLVESIANNSPF